jgi:hypothetical protein
MTTINYLYAVVFLSQVLVVSLYTPTLVRRRVRTLLATRPPAEYPQLYPVPVATIERTLRLYRILTAGIAVLGLALAAWFYTIDAEMLASAYAYAIYTCLQVAPVLLWTHWETRYFQRMRATAPNSIRRAELKPRRLRDFVSPTLLGLAVTTYLGATASLVFLSAAFIQEPLLTSTFLFTAMTIGNLFAAVASVWMLRGRKLDPHQTNDDRTRRLRAGWRAMFVTIILVNTYVALQSLLHGFGLFDYVGFAASLLTQFFAVASGKASVAALDQEDFEVYRANTNRAGAVAAHK